MTDTLMLLARVAGRRVKNGEKLTSVLKSYPKLTDSEKTELKKRLAGK